LHPPEEGDGRLTLIPAPEPSVDVLDAFASLERSEDQFVGLGAPFSNCTVCLPEVKAGTWSP